MARESFQRQLERKVSGDEPSARAARRVRPGRPADLDDRAVPGQSRVCVTSLGVSTGPRRGHDQQAGHARADAAMGAGPDDARQGRRVGDHRARLGLRRPRRHAHERAARRRRVRPQRPEDLDHQRAVRRHDRALRQARRRQRRGHARPQGPDLRPRHGHGGPRAGHADAQDGPARLAHRRGLPLDVRAGRDRLLGETEEPKGGGRQSAKDNFVAERAGVAAMSLGVIEECLRLSVDYAKHRTLWGTPIARLPARSS